MEQTKYNQYRNNLFVQLPLYYQILLIYKSPYKLQLPSIFKFYVNKRVLDLQQNSQLQDPSFLTVSFIQTWFII